MNKKILYSVIAVIVVIIVIVAVLVVTITPTKVVTPPAKPTMTVSTSTIFATVGQSVTCYAFITGGTPSKIVFNFGDGVTGNATLLTGNEYTVSHSYTSPGKYLVIANATVKGTLLNNLNSIDEVTVIPPTVTAAEASELTTPSIITSSPIHSEGSNVVLTGSTLEPPTAVNWTIGYYIWKFGDGTSHTDYAIFNTSSGSFLPDTVSHVFSTSGIYPVNFGVITFNATKYVPSNYTVNGNLYTYYPVSDLTSILSGTYFNNTYVSTIFINATGQTALLKNTTVVSKNPSEITYVEVVPGGPITLDPATEYYTASFEVDQNIYETLVAYNESSTTQYVSVIAQQVPTMANGLISSNGLTYTFNIRSGLKFSNGDPVTAWDVYTSAVRQLLFTEAVPSTGNWIIATDLLPDGGYAPSFVTTAIYNNITSAVSVNNTTQAVTFHLLQPDPAFLAYCAQDLLIEDYNWVSTNGGGITFTPAGFLSYEKNGNMVNYNSYLQYNTMGSGPYMQKEYVIGQQIVLVPNPNFVTIPGSAGYTQPVNNTITFIYEKDASTAYLFAANGLADIIWGLPTYYYTDMTKLVSAGKIQIVTYATTEIWFYNFNFAVNTTDLSALGSQYTIPPYYFSNPDVRRAFADAYNYTEFINQLLGNAVYGADFGFNYCGVIPKGMPGYVPTSELYNVPSYNLTLAKQCMEASGYYNTTVNLPIVVLAGDPIDFAGANMWAASLASMDPHIHASALYLLASTVAGYLVPGGDPMPIYYWGYAPDYMYPSDYMNPMLKLGGFYPVGNEWNSSLMASLGYTNESQQFNEMQSLIDSGESTSNITLAIQDFDQAQQISINLTLLLYNYQTNNIYYFSPSLHGISLENSPLLGGAEQLKLFFLTKY
jgi:ABC-type transport system substrate-binding protein